MYVFIYSLQVFQVGRQDGGRACSHAFGCYYARAADAGVWHWGCANISFW